MTTMQRRRFAFAAAVLLAAACSPGKPAFKNIDISGASYAQALALPDVEGRTRTLAEFKGKVAIVFFGFAQCPDVCPGTLAEIAEARQRLGPDGAKVQPVFVTVDPERDTADVLKAYVAGFGSDIVALRGSLEQTQAVAKDFKVFFAKVPGRQAGSYSIDHTAGAFVYDPQGRVRLFVRYGTGAGAEALASDLKVLLGGA